MTRQAHTIERLAPPVDDADVRALARLLVDAVDSGAAVSFLAPLTLERAEEWWRTVVTASTMGGENGCPLAEPAGHSNSAPLRGCVSQ